MPAGAPVPAPVPVPAPPAPPPPVPRVYGVTVLSPWRATPEPPPPVSTMDSLRMSASVEHLDQKIGPLVGPNLTLKIKLTTQYWTTALPLKSLLMVKLLSVKEMMLF